MVGWNVGTLTKGSILLMVCVILFTAVLSPDRSAFSLPHWAERGKVFCDKESSWMWVYSPEMLRKWQPCLCSSLPAGGKVSRSTLWICHHQSDQSWPPQKHREKLPSGSKWWVASVSSWGHRHYSNIPSVHRVDKRALGTEPEHSVANQTWAGITAVGGSQVDR